MKLLSGEWVMVLLHKTVSSNVCSMTRLTQSDWNLVMMTMIALEHLSQELFFFETLYHHQCGTLERMDCCRSSIATPKI